MMVRRHLYEDPVSRLALWARRMAAFAFAATLLAIVLVRSELVENLPAVAAFGGALLMAVVALLLSLAALGVIWMHGLAGMGAAVTAAVVSLALLAYPAYLGVRAYKLPWIYDITTDPIDPPRYEALAGLRSRDSNPVNYPGLYTAELQRAAYADIGPLGTSASPQNAFDAVVSVVNRRRFRVVDARAPQAGRREGRVEAVARTPIMGFRDDVVIRIRPEPDGGSRIDVRSSSRYGTFDFGVNAARVRTLIDEIEEALINQKPPAPTPPPVRKKDDKKKKGKDQDKR